LARRIGGSSKKFSWRRKKKKKQDVVTGGGKGKRQGKISPTMRKKKFPHRERPAPGEGEVQTEIKAGKERR